MQLFLSSLRKILPLKNEIQVITSASSNRSVRNIAITTILYGVPLVLLIVLTSSNRGSTDDATSQIVSEIIEDDHVIITFVIHLFFEKLDINLKNCDVFLMLIGALVLVMDLNTLTGIGRIEKSIWR